MSFNKRSAVRKGGHRRLSFEQFEARRMMAVTTSLNSGTLTITGDAAADDIAIVGTANAGEITVVGRNGTLVDGVPQDGNGESRVTIAGVTADLIAEFGDGDNIINVDNVYLNGRMEIETETGDDRITFGATGVVSSRGACLVLAGDGNDIVRLEDYKVFIVGQLSVSLQVGDGMESANVIGASSQTSVLVSGGSAGSHEIILRGVTSGGNLEVNVTAPINNVAIFTSAASANLLVFGSSGHNSIYVDTCYAARFIQVLSASSDTNFVPQPPEPAPYNIDQTITVARCQTPQIVVRTDGGPHPEFFGGNDTIFVYGNNIVGPPVQVTVPGHVAAHVLYVETGDGNDDVSASYNVANGDWFISLSQLDDILTLTGNQASGFVSADGGTGTNRLNLFSNQFGGFASTRFS
jgi:hypothetical protein